MKTNANGLLPTALGTHYGTRKTTVAHALLVTRTDAEVYAFTSHDVSDTISSVVYSSRPGLKISQIVIAAGFDVGNLELETLHDGTVFTTADILGGVWRNAEWLIFRYNFESISDGVEPVLGGKFGEVTIKQNSVIVELRDIRQYFQQPVGSLTSKTCRYRLGVNDGVFSRCPVRLDPPAWAATTAYTVRQTGDSGTGSVVKHSSVGNRHFKCTTAGTSGGSAPSWNTTIGGTTTDNTVTWTTIQALTVTGSITASPAPTQQVFRDSARTEAADFFAEGTLTWLTGANAGRSAKVRSYDADGTFHLALPMISTVSSTETYSVTAGCRKRWEEDCKTKFDALLDFGGEKDKPGIDAITAAPGVSV